MQRKLHGGIKLQYPLLQQLHMDYIVLIGEAEAPAVIECHRHEWRHMKGFFEIKLVALVGRMFSHIVPAVVDIDLTFIPRGIGNFTEDKDQLAGGIKNQIKHHRIKAKAECTRQSQDPDGRGMR